MHEPRNTGLGIASDIRRRSTLSLFRKGAMQEVNFPKLPIDFDGRWGITGTTGGPVQHSEVIRARVDVPALDASLLTGTARRGRVGRGAAAPRSPAVTHARNQRSSQARARCCMSALNSWGVSSRSPR
jgi:hypothetical protein